MVKNNQIQESRRKYLYIFFILITLLIIFILIIYFNKQINSNFLVANNDLKDLKYNININCKWIAESELNDLTVNKTKASDLCRGIFPELFIVGGLRANGR